MQRTTDLTFIVFLRPLLYNVWRGGRRGGEGDIRAYNSSNITWQWVEQERFCLQFPWSIYSSHKYFLSSMKRGDKKQKIKNGQCNLQLVQTKNGQNQRLVEGSQKRWPGSQLEDTWDLQTEKKTKTALEWSPSRTESDGQPGNMRTWGDFCSNVG